MNTIALRLSPERVRALRALLDAEVRPHLTPDVSSYAKGRTRCWLMWEGPLSKWRGYAPALNKPALWKALCALWREAGGRDLPDLGLALHGPVGIGAHRDASYAHADAVTVNLGRAEWGHHPARHGNDPAGLAWTQLEGGEIIRFDAKHLHASRNIDPERWAVVLWRAKRPLPVKRAA